MELVIGLHSLAGTGGTETYALTIADHLQRLGHDVRLYAAEDGPLAARAAELGVPTALGERDLPASPDAVIAQDAAAAYELAAALDEVPQVFVAHSDLFDLQLPPQLPGLTAAVVALYDRVERRVRALGWSPEVVRLAQPVDVERFKPVRPLPPRPRLALALGNYVHGERLEVLERACARAGVELRRHGQHAAGGVTRSEVAIQDADIVFGKARVILEAMACGRAAYVYDHNGAEGWVTRERHAALAADNFGGQAEPVAADEERLVRDLDAYDPAMGMANRDLAVAHHAATGHAAALVEVVRRAARPEPRRDVPLRELARLVRLYHRADVLAFAARAEAAKAASRLRPLEDELAAARTEAERLRTELGVAREEARRGRAALERMRSSRRWGAVQALLAPADRLRGRR